MKEKIVFELNSVYRDNMRIKGYSFGEGENSACIVGATRGNEVQQLYICSRLINIFKQLEHQGKIKYGKSVMVIPTVNSHSMNIGKRFWSTDNTDIVFENISSYQYGIQFTSFYMQGDYIPHVRVMQTGFEDIELAKDFGLPYVFRRNARPYDTTTLNYNWQLWGAKAFSVYTSATDSIDIISAREAINAVLSFLNKQGIIQYRCHEGYISQFIEGHSLISVKSSTAGIFVRRANVDSRVKKGEIIAEIMDPYTGEIADRIIAPQNGIVFFHVNQPLIYSQTPLFRIIPTDDLV